MKKDFEVKMRPATKEDKESVLALDPENEIYGGIDYVPANYDGYLHDPDVDMRVACVDDKIVRTRLK